MQTEKSVLLKSRLPIEEDPRWLLTQRVLASDTFSKSARLANFLAYVSECSLTGRHREINEQSIGESVFNRPSGYDPGQDNIVRVHASRLRQKLHVYFQHEGAAEPVRIVIPKGGYAPQFETSQSVQSTLSGPSQTDVISIAASAGASNEQSRLRPATLPLGWPFYTGAAFLALILALVIFATTQSRLSLFGAHFIRLPQYRNHALWQSMFEMGRPTLIVPADNGLVLYESQANKNVSLSQYVNGDVQTVPQINPSATLDSATSKTAYRYTSIVDLRVTADLIALPEALEHPPAIRYARDLKLNDLKGANVVLIGAKDANPWVSLFEDRMDFAFDIDRQIHASIVSNRKPHRGEEPEYRRYASDPASRAFAAIAYLPNLNTSGNVLIIEGTTMAGTEAAADFILQEKRLQNVIKWDGYGHLPHFELLLESTSLGGNAPDSKVLAYRVHP